MDEFDIDDIIVLLKILGILAYVTIFIILLYYALGDIYY
jgi:hypothetical protein